MRDQAEVTVPMDDWVWLLDLVRAMDIEDGEVARLDQIVQGVKVEGRPDE